MKAPFEKVHPGTTLVFNFAASGSLLQQMQQGAPVDVFASADQETMDKAGTLIDAATRANFAGNALVLIVPAKNSPVLSDPEDLTGDEFKLIAIGNPDSVPVGRYTKGALNAAGLFDPLTPKFVMAESVRQVLDYVARSEVQAGFVYATDAAVRTDKVKVAAEVAEQAHLLPHRPAGRFHEQGCRAGIHRLRQGRERAGHFGQVWFQEAMKFTTDMSRAAHDSSRRIGTRQERFNQSRLIR